LISNPLNGTNNQINTIMPVAPDGSQAITWNVAGQQFFGQDTWFDVQSGNPADNGWYDNFFVKSTRSIAPGEAFFLYNFASSDFVMTFVGEVPQGNLTNAIPSNYSFKSSIVPQAVEMLSVGFPEIDGLQYITWDPIGQHYNGAFTWFDVQSGNPADNGFYNNSFVKQTVIPAVGQGFLIFNPLAPGKWGRTFSVN
jgi:hypothetical protein